MASEHGTTAIVGLIVGKGYTKVVCEDRYSVFPSLAASVRDLGYQSTMKEVPDIVDLNGQGRWFVGDDVLRHARNRAENLREISRYTSPAFMALVRHAFDTVVPNGATDLRVATGIPAAWFSHKETRKELQEAIRIAAAPRSAEVKVAPESAGLFYDWAFEGGTMHTDRISRDGDKREVGIIDIGFRDMNLSWFRGRQYMHGTSVRGGIVEALEFVKRSVMEQYRLEVSDHQVDKMVRTGSVRVQGRDYPLPTGTMELIQEGANVVLSEAKNFFPNEGREFDYIVLGGGTSVYLVNALLDCFPQITVPYAALDLEHMSAEEITRAVSDANPQLSGPRGFRKINALMS